MDPITILQIVGGAVSLGNVVVKCISGLTTFKTRFYDAPVHVSTMIGQLHIVQIALVKLEGWNQTNSHAPRYLQLAAEIGYSLDSFEVLILALEKHLSKLDSPDPSNMSAKSKMSFIWSEKEIADYSNLLDRQVNAMTLLLQALQCKTWAQQQVLMDLEESRSIVHLARTCSTSILGLRDDTQSVYSETTANISIMFEFDTLILRSKIYQQAHRSHLRQALRAKKNSRNDLSMSSSNGNDTTEHAQRIGLSGALDIGGGSESFLSQETEKNDVGTARVLGHVHDEGNPTAPTTPPSASKDVEGKSAGPSSFGSAPTSKPSRQINPFRWNNWLKKVPRRKDSISSPAAIEHPQRDDSTPFPDMDETPQGKDLIPSPAVTEPPRKILILGTGESGKSTLLKALRIPLQKYSLTDRSSVHEIIWSNLVNSTRVVLQSMEERNILLQDRKYEYHIRAIWRQPYKIKRLGDFENPIGVVRAVGALWQDGGFQHAYRLRREYQLDDNFAYYATHVNRIISPAYVPTDEDILRSRVQSTGRSSHPFLFNNLGYDVFDVGGTRQERGRWIYTIGGVSTIIFTIDAECFAKKLREDQNTNRMEDQLETFDCIVNNGWCADANFLLVFTKMDCVEECLHEVPMDIFLPNYSWDMLSPYESYMRYIEKRFVDVILSDEIRERTKITWASLVEENTGLLIWRLLDSIEHSQNPSLQTTIPQL